MNIKIKVTKPRAIVLALLVSLVVVAVAIAGKPGWYSQDEHMTNAIATKAQTDVPYPINQMNHFLERENLKRRLLAFNNSNKIGYLYIMSFGKFVGYYTVKGKISSTQSQMTVTTQTWDNPPQTASSMGDDGTYGPEEGGDKGVFFFTTAGVMVETTLDWIYSDAPLHIDVPNLLTGSTATPTK